MITVFIRAVISDGHVTKFHTVHNNAFEIVLEKIRSRNFEYTPEVKWKICQIRLQNAATNMDFDKLQSEQMIAQDLLRKIFI